MRNMRRKTLLLSAALLLAASHTFAQVSTEVINGLSYKINARTHTATLVGDEDNPYTGNIVVPETVTAQDGTDYSVTPLARSASSAASTWRASRSPPPSPRSAPAAS